MSQHPLEHNAPTELALLRAENDRLQREVEDLRRQRDEAQANETAAKTMQVELHEALVKFLQKTVAGVDVEPAEAWCATYDLRHALLDLGIGLTPTAPVQEPALQPMVEGVKHNCGTCINGVHLFCPLIERALERDVNHGDVVTWRLRQQAKTLDEMDGCPGWEKKP